MSVVIHRCSLCVIPSLKQTRSAEKKHGTSLNPRHGVLASYPVCHLPVQCFIVQESGSVFLFEEACSLSLAGFLLLERAEVYLIQEALPKPVEMGHRTVYAVHLQLVTVNFLTRGHLSELCKNSSLKSQLTRSWLGSVTDDRNRE